MVTEASNGIELSLVEPAYRKRETLPDPSSVTSKTRLSTVMTTWQGHTVCSHKSLVPVP